MRIPSVYNFRYRSSSTSVIETSDCPADITGVMGLGDKIKEAREAKGLSQAAVAKALGISQPAIRKIESGQTVKSRYLGEVTRYLGLGTPRFMVQIVGLVGAGSQVHLFSEGQGYLGEVEAPEDAPETTVAVEIRGSSLGEFFDGGYVFYDDVRSPITDDLIGKPCVVGLADGRVMVKKVQRSKGNHGLYHLFSNTGEPPVTDVEIEWAARVITIKPR